MKKSITHALHLFFLFLSISNLQSQNLPKQMHFSDDEKRLITGGVELDGFYDEAVINTIELFFDEPNYWSLMTTNYSSGTDLGALAIINGDTLASEVGVRFKGTTSYLQIPNTQKKSFNIALDFEDSSQDYDGYETLNLNNCFQDPSFMREVMFYHIARKHIPIANANYVHLYINGQNWGIYPNVQQLNGEFFKEWFMSNDGTSWRAIDPNFMAGGGGGPGGGGNPFGTGESTLNWLGTDSGVYEEAYTLKRTEKDDPWEDLIHTCDVLNNTPLTNLEDALKNVLDVDRTLWYLAHEIIFTDDDSYVWKGGMDYYLYWEPETGRMVPQEYDANSCMKIDVANWSPFYNQNDQRFVLMNRLFAVPELRQRYLAHVRTIIEESLDTSVFNAQIETYFDLIADEVNADTKKIYNYNQFLTQKEELKEFIVERRNFLLNNSEVNVEGLDISNAVFSVDGTPFSKPDAGEAVTVTAEVSGALGISNVNLYYSTGFVGSFEKTTMYDDGAHGDGAANDGTYGATIPGFGNGTYVRFYVEALADNTAKTATYFPTGAEHDVFIYRVNVTGYVPTEVVINEFMASNESSAADQDGEYDDWIELYNTSDDAIDLSGWYLSDDASNLSKWEIPPGTTINGDSYLIVWADEDGSQDGLHANFKLSKSGEILFLIDPDLNIAQEIEFAAQETGMGYAREPNGTGDFVIKAHTFNANNDEPLAADEAEGLFTEFMVFPNPTSSSFSVNIDSEQATMLSVFDLFGRQMEAREFYKNTHVDVNDWPSGLYLVKVGQGAKKLVVE